MSWWIQKKDPGSSRGALGAEWEDCVPLGLVFAVGAGAGQGAPGCPAGSQGQNGMGGGQCDGSTTPPHPLLPISEVCYQLVPSTPGDTSLRGLGGPTGITELLITTPKAAHTLARGAPAARAGSPFPPLLSPSCWASDPPPPRLSAPRLRPSLPSTLGAPLPVQDSPRQPGLATLLPTSQDRRED